MNSQNTDGVFECRFPVRFHDIDAAGLIFFAKIHEYCHVAFEELMASLGYTPTRFFKEEGLGAPFVHVDSDFFAPLLHGDTMRIQVRVARLGRSSIHMFYRVLNQNGELCAEVRTVQTCVDRRTVRARELPAHLREGLGRFMDEGPAEN